jgi:hypothetical protein
MLELECSFQFKQCLHQEFSMSGSSQSPLKSASTPSPFRSIGIWMSLFLIVYMLYNVVRSALNPTDFISSFGFPPATVSTTTFVLVYSIRALFLGLFGLVLLLRRNFQALSLFVLVGTVMPLGDAALVAGTGAPFPTILRHLLIAGFLLLTWFFLRRWIQVQPVEAINR